MSSPGNGEGGRRARVTIREIAELAGVSIATVSRVVNGRDDVSEETREVVQRIVREHGYSANRSARGHSAGRTAFLCVTVPQPPHAHLPLAPSVPPLSQPSTSTTAFMAPALAPAIASTARRPSSRRASSTPHV
jgi:hypothetical protein